MRAIGWAITGCVLFLFLQIMVTDRFEALEQAFETNAYKAGFTGFALFLIGFMIVGGSLTKKLVHPYEYAVVTFTGPMGLFAAFPIVLDFLTR